VTAEVDCRNVAPGPRLGLVGAIFGAREPADQLELLLSAAMEYGPVVRITVGKRFLHLLDDPAHIRYVLQSNARNYRKSKNYEPLKLVVGEGLLTSEGRSWRRQRRLMQPAFHRRRLEALGSVIVEEAEAVSARWADRAGRGEPLNVTDEMTGLALRAVSRALLGSDVERETQKISAAQAFLNRYVDSRMSGFFHLPPHVPTPRNFRFKRALADLDGVVYGIIDERLQRGEGGDDLLGMLLGARDEETGEAMTRRQLRDEVATILLAGHETTANALSWTWYLLAQHPEAESRLHGELESVLGGRTPTFKDLEYLHYARAVLEEVLRLYPPAWAISRRPIEDDEIAGYRIPAGSTVLVSPYVTHRNPRFWEVPDVFDPERFKPEHAKDRSPYAYFPFGGGPRKCVGNGFAMMEGRLVLATLAQRYRLRPVPGQRVELEPIVTLRPKHSIYVTPEER
jgi:cytochrome P450